MPPTPSFIAAVPTRCKELVLLLAVFSASFENERNAEIPWVGSAVNRSSSFSVKAIATNS